ncbi:MAG: DEAD/DEAH box helicase [Pirellulales bacterium]
MSATIDTASSVRTDLDAIENNNIDIQLNETQFDQPAPADPAIHASQADQGPREEQAEQGADVTATIAPTKKSAADFPMTFSDLPLSDDVKLAVMQSGYVSPTEIQSRIIPYILEGRDVLAQSQTGTGKTAAFALPILSRLQMGQRLPQVLVLAPTRELALQVTEAFEKYGSNMRNLRVVSIYGGADYQPQLRALRSGVDVVVGTPGRVIDHLERGTLSLDALKCLVLDEADEMLSMGFQEDVERILQATPEQKQIALFSATMPPAIRGIADQYLIDPATITIGRKTLTAESIVQRCVFTPERLKLELLTRLLELEDTDGVIVFTKTKESTVQVADKLSRLGFSAAALNGDLPQLRRQKTVDELKAGRLDVLVATDVAARGLDVQRISHVINYDLPHDGEAYVHRIGRTGRAGRTGVAYIFLTPIQQRKLSVIERLTKQPIEVVDFPTADQLNAKRICKFKEDLQKTIESQDISVFHRMVTEFAFEKDIDLITIAAAIAHQARRGRPFLAKDVDLDLPRKGKSTGRDGGRDSGRDGGRDRRSRFDERNEDRRDDSRSGDRGRRQGPREFDDQRGPRRKFGGDHRGDDQRGEGQRGGRDRGRTGSGRGGRRSGMQVYRLAVGSQDGVRPRNIVGAIANESGVSGNAIGPIEIHRTYTLIELPSDLGHDVLQTLKRTWVAGRQLKIRPYSE